MTFVPFPPVVKDKWKGVVYSSQCRLRPRFKIQPSFWIQVLARIIFPPFIPLINVKRSCLQFPMSPAAQIQVDPGLSTEQIRIWLISCPLPSIHPQFSYIMVSKAISNYTVSNICPVVIASSRSQRIMILQFIFSLDKQSTPLNEKVDQKEWYSLGHRVFWYACGVYQVLIIHDQFVCFVIIFLDS